MKSRKKRLSLSKIYVSKAEVKHTSSKAIITIYTYNKERKSLIKRIYLLKKKFSLKRNIVFKEYFSEFISVVNHQMKNRHSKKKFFLKRIKGFLKKINFIFNKERFLYYPKNSKEILKLKLRRELNLIKRLKYKLSLNNYKFEEKFLYKLSKLIGRFYKKKIEFNIINLKSFMLNSDIFTEILTIKIKRKRAAMLRLMKFFINKAFATKMAKENMVTKKSNGRLGIAKSVDLSLLENKFQNFNLSSIVNEGANSNFDEVLNKLYYNVVRHSHNEGASSAQPEKQVEKDVLNRDYSKVNSIIFESIRYKHIAGLRLEVKGRLTKRYRADKSVFKLKQKGGIQNMYSSKLGIPSVMYRGYADANVDYSIQTSKVRIGSFAVKG
jgi:ribosomal VAR1-like protein